MGIHIKIMYFENFRKPKLTVNTSNNSVLFIIINSYVKMFFCIFDFLKNQTKECVPEWPNHTNGYLVIIDRKHF